ncbi:glycosyltransferase family 2 protein [Muriicola marianensis]|nr:glycosyltransferase family 2 protein [Muriicola marianensis]
MKVKEIPESLYQTLKLRYGTRYGPGSSSKPQVPVVVSLTTIEPRLRLVDLVIRSLLTQSVAPKKILLWIHESLLTKLPPRLTSLQNEIFEIRPTPLHCSHKKLIHSLEAYPSERIITCDDDLMYRPQWLQRLYEESERYPRAVIGNQTRTIRTDAQGNFLPYEQWPVDLPEQDASPWVLPIGAEGVLYPPGSLNPLYSRDDLFLKLAPKADDLWFKSMSLLNGTVCRPASNSGKKGIPIMGSQKFSLKHENIKKDLNSVQWRQLVDHFDLRKFLSHE